MAARESKRREPLNLDPDCFWVYGRRGRESRVVRLLLARGRLFERGTPSPRRGGWYRAPKSCFRNAYLNADRDRGRYLYCEGFCWYDGGWPFRHAWFIDRQAPDEALDTTLTRDEKYRYFGISVSWRSAWAVRRAENGHASVLDYWEKMYWQRKRKG
jgi:hypothetical protein